MSHIDRLVYHLMCCTVIGLCASQSSVNRNNTQTVVIGDPNAKKTVVIAYLMDQLEPPYRIGAISKAINEGQANGLLQGFNFTVHDSGLKHILSHHGESRAAVYRRLFQILWFGNQVGKLATGSSGVPTYVYPPEILATVRVRFPDVQAGRRDAEFCNSDVKVYNVTWEDFANVKWPSPPKACKTCAVQNKKPY